MQEQLFLRTINDLRGNLAPESHAGLGVPGFIPTRSYSSVHFSKHRSQGRTHTHRHTHTNTWAPWAAVCGWTCRGNGVLLPHSTQTTSTAGCSLPERQRPGPSTEIILITIITFFSPLNRFQKNGTVHWLSVWHGVAWHDRVVHVAVIFQSWGFIWRP